MEKECEGILLKDPKDFGSWNLVLVTWKASVLS
jgi:hypothetical protein